ncbi:ABC transporter permease [Perlabentimonas gracilis]|uniref:ABC transporter permease n=1 Tax=Perlabentimonas gracilis TaxID=2715279 RepID=UPI001409B07F|nr:ABC transporter permease [Perlabentimonas gracilis]NHB69119.1 FtsX-like permease family protein [Perlabentimonas gracilis]
MVSHFIKTSFRQFLSNKLFTIINLFGLAVSMAVCFVIFLFAWQEANFDRFHQDYQNIYRINIAINSQGHKVEIPLSSAPMGVDLNERFPEVTDFTRLGQSNATKVNINNQFYEFDNVMMADSNFFSFFSFKLLEGDARTVLKNPRSVVLTQSSAEALFPNVPSPIGEVIRINDVDGWEITGIANNPPENSHIEFDFLTSLSTLTEGGRSIGTWTSHISYYTYLKLVDDFDMRALDEKTEELAFENINKEFEPLGTTVAISYEPITNIRLHSEFNNEIRETGTFHKVKWFSLIAIFLLIIAGVNYVNLTISVSGKRAKETGLKKVFGASRWRIRLQFLSETFLITAISFVMALLTVELVLPLFNSFLGVNLSLLSAPVWFYVSSFFIFSILFGFFAGIYPAFHMASFIPIKILKGELWKKSNKFSLRSALLTVQFAVSIGLIISTLVVYIQLNYFQNQGYGFDHTNLVAIRVTGSNYKQEAELLKQELSANPWVKEITLASSIPGLSHSREGFLFEGSENSQISHHLQADRNFLNTISSTLAEGRYFSGEDGMELEHAVVNQELVRRAGWLDPLGKTVEGRDGQFRIVGVVKDFHLESLHEPVPPLVITALGHEQDHNLLWVLINFENQSLSGAVSETRVLWNKIFPEKYFYYESLDNLLGSYYDVERNFGKMFMFFSVLSILIAMFGVIGLSAMTARQRMKEVAVRRVLGATASDIVKKFSGEYLLLVAIASFAAIPLALYFMIEWLANFAYSIGFPYWTTIVSVVIIGVIVTVIVFLQSLKVASNNPTITLKYE